MLKMKCAGSPLGFPACADGETAVHLQLAFPIAVQMDLLAARHSALNPQRLTNDGNARWGGQFRQLGKESGRCS